MGKDQLRMEVGPSGWVQFGRNLPKELKSLRNLFPNLKCQPKPSLGSSLVKIIKEAILLSLWNIQLKLMPVKHGISKALIAYDGEI